MWVGGVLVGDGDGVCVCWGSWGGGELNFASYILDGLRNILTCLDSFYDKPM